MSGWEYKVVPAPTKGVKARGVKGPEGRFANAIESLMNDMGASGWEYQRAETLPSVERAGLTGSTTEWRNLLVFRRPLVQALDDFEPELLPAPNAPDVATALQNSDTSEPNAPTDPEPGPETGAGEEENNQAGPADKPGKDNQEPMPVKST